MNNSEWEMNLNFQQIITMMQYMKRIFLLYVQIKY